jgi:transcriptional regulator GlxA family with amidase domain
MCNLQFSNIMQNKKFNPLADSDNQKSLAELCIWIDKNIETSIGWEELTTTSGLTHSELQFLFSKYKQTTPMTYIRKQREDSEKVKPNFIVTPNFLAKKSD